MFHTWVILSILILTTDYSVCRFMASVIVKKEVLTPPWSHLWCFRVFSSLNFVFFRGFMRLITVRYVHIFPHPHKFLVQNTNVCQSLDHMLILCQKPMVTRCPKIKNKTVLLKFLVRKNVRQYLVYKN